MNGREGFTSGFLLLLLGSQLPHLLLALVFGELFHFLAEFTLVDARVHFLPALETLFGRKGGKSLAFRASFDFCTRFSFRTRVGIVKDLPAGTDISYGRTHTLRRDSTVAILCAGYGDGISRTASNRAEILIRGKRCPVLGRVTMDQTIIDVTEVPGVISGDEAVLVGRQLGAEISIVEFSNWSGTIPWEVLCSVTKRVPRVYKTALGL